VKSTVHTLSFFACIALIQSNLQSTDPSEKHSKIYSIPDSLVTAFINLTAYYMDLYIVMITITGSGCPNGAQVSLNSIDRQANVCIDYLTVGYNSLVHQDMLLLLRRGIEDGALAAENFVFHMITTLINRDTGHPFEAVAKVVIDHRSVSRVSLPHPN
jgi:hypothetical protein